MNVFELRDRLIHDFASYVSSFIQIRNPRIAQHVDRSLADGLLWPEPLIQLNLSFEPGDRIDDLAGQAVLHEECRRIFRIEADRALRALIGYRIYLDQRRGWRITSPNLEQCGLLKIHYESLDELWSSCHEALAGFPSHFILVLPDRNAYKISGVAFVVTGGVALMLWREGRR